MPRPLLLALCISSLLYLVLCLYLPVALYSNAIDDDALFASHAGSIISGHWLGPYGLRTLAKGPGFPLFLAANALLGLPITMSLALLYAAACAFFAWCLYRLTGAAWLSLVVFLAIEWHPAVFPVRIARDDVTPAQLLLLLGCLIQFAFVARAGWPRWLWALAGGLDFGWFWMTREDVIWVVPGVMFMLAAQCCLSWRRGAGLRGAAAIAVFLLAAFGLHAAVATVNLVEYGTFQTVDFKGAAFERAVQDLQSVRVGPPVPFVPVPAKVRQAIDRVSPAFAALAPYFNGPGRAWMSFGCAVDKSTCGDFAGGWFVFALRDAVAWDGQYGTPRQAAAYYRTISRQVEAACRSGRLTCAPGLSFMPAVTRSQWAELPAEIGRLYDMVALVDPLALGGPSTGDETQLQAMETILDRPKRTPSQSELSAVTLHGWFIASSTAWPQFLCTAPGHQVVIPIPRLPSADLATYFKQPGLDFDRFDVAAPADDGCGLQIAPEGAGGDVLALSALKPGPAFLPAGELYLDSVTRPVAAGAGAPAQSVLQALRWVYRLVFPLAGVAAILSYLWSLGRLCRGRPVGRLLILATGLWILLLSRCLVLLLVDISAFPAISQLYMLPAFPVSCMAIIISAALPWRANRPPEPALVNRTG
jgi:hypothetical protein